MSEYVSPVTYFMFTYGSFTLLIILSLYINDITVIFGFLGAFVESIFNFILPGFLYLKASSLKKRKTNPWLVVSSYGLILTGVLLFFVANYNNVNKVLALF